MFCSINADNIQRGRFWVDLAVVTGIKNDHASGLTLNWNLCCQEAMRKEPEDVADDVGYVVHHYTHCLLRDAGSIRIEPKRKSYTATSGLMYSQGYPQSKM